MLRKQKASVLLFTLMMLSIITFLTLQFMRNVLIGSRFNNSMVAREQARMVAVSGINLAISQLTKKASTEKNIQEKQPEDKPLKDFLTRVLPNLNRWQTFNLKEDVDGFEGQIKFCITCENGKININEAFDFEKQEFKKEFNNLLKGLHIKGKLPEGEIVKRLTEFLKQSKTKLNDISQLSEVPGLESIDVYYKPPKKPKGKKKAMPNVDITLQDLFTVSTVSDKMELLFFSDSLLAVFDMKRPTALGADLLKDKYKKLIGSFKENWGASWDKNWQHMQPIYGSEPKKFKSFAGVLCKEFGPKVYSVLSCGKVKGVRQKLLVVIKEIKEKEEDDKKETSSKHYFKIIKLYWL